MATLVAYQIDGVTLPTGSSTHNNVGLIRLGGNIAGTRFAASNLGKVLTGGGVYDTSSANPSVRTAMKLNASGNFALMIKGTYVIRKVSTALAGVANTKILTGASDFGFRDSIHARHSTSTVRTASALRANKFNMTTGRWDSGEPPAVSENFANAAGTLTATNDDASTPTRAIPGELTYRSGKPSPVDTDYPAKTGG